ncbi:hypothetical protein D3C78_1974840 [compost metagenome]
MEYIQQMSSDLQRQGLELLEAIAYFKEAPAAAITMTVRPAGGSAALSAHR